MTSGMLAVVPFVCKLAPGFPVTQDGPLDPASETRKGSDDGFAIGSNGRKASNRPVIPRDGHALAALDAIDDPRKMGLRFGNVNLVTHSV